MRVIAASAIYSRTSAQGRHLEALGVDGFLQKPFKLEELADALRASGLTVGEPVGEPPPGRLALLVAGQPLPTSSIELRGSVLEVTVTAGRLSAGDRVEVSIPGAPSGVGVVFSAVPDERTSRCRVALEDPSTDQLEALAAALAR